MSAGSQPRQLAATGVINPQQAPAVGMVMSTNQTDGATEAKRRRISPSKAQVFLSENYFISYQNLFINFSNISSCQLSQQVVSVSCIGVYNTEWIGRRCKLSKCAAAAYDASSPAESGTVEHFFCSQLELLLSCNTQSFLLYLPSFPTLLIVRYLLLLEVSFIVLMPCGTGTIIFLSATFVV